MGTGFGGIFQQQQQQASSSSQSQSQPQPQPQLQPQPQPPQQVSTSLNSGNNEITNYQTFNSDKYDLGYSESDYPIKDDETPTYCTSKHPRINFFFFASFYFVFIMFGSIVFLIIEQPREIESREKLITLQESFITKYPQVEVEDIKNLIKVLLKAQQDGYFVPIVGSDLILSEEPTNPVSEEAKSSEADKEKINPQQSSQPPDELPITEPITEPTTVPTTPIIKIKRLNEKFAIDKSTTSSVNLSQTNEALVSYEIANDHENVTSNRSTLKLQMMKPITNWRFSSSLLFVTSLVTTVGYGNLTPLTVTGKITCIVFCIIGVPATLTFFSTLVTIFVRGPVKTVEAWIIGVIIKLHQSASVFVVRILHLIIITTFLLCVCLFLPAYFFYINEDDWTYLESFYCCFISLTTIGLGDFVPGIEGPMADLLYPFIIVVYLFFGLSMIMVWLALIHRIPQLNLSDALVADDKEEDKLAEEENNKNRERLRILTNQLILQHKLKEIKSMRLQESLPQIKINQSLVP